MNMEFLIKTASSLDLSEEVHSKWAANAIDMAVSESLSKDEADEISIFAEALENLRYFANILDSDGKHLVADKLDYVLRKCAEEDSAYNYKKHKDQSFFTSLKEEAKKSIEPMFDSLKDMGHPLLTRYSPDYPGVMMQRISDGVYQDLLSKKVYDFRTGFISDTGVRYYGGSVSQQTPNAEDWKGYTQVYESSGLRQRPQ